MNSVSVNDNDVLEDSSMNGRVRGGADAYRFTGEMTNLAIDGDATVYLNGEEIDIDRFSREPVISVKPESIDFGDVTIGENASETVRISNEGEATLRVTGTTVIGPNASEFAVRNDSASVLTVPPNASRTVSVEFAPVSTGDKSATLRVESNATDEPSTNVSFAGSATPREVRLNVTANETTVATDEAVEFTVVREDTGEAVNATITVDDTGLTTDADGTVVYAFTEAGTFSATATKPATASETFVEDSATVTVEDATPTPPTTGESLSFEEANVGDTNPPAPWYIKEGATKTSGKNTREISDEYASEGSKSMHVASYGDLREIQIAVDVDLTDVETVMYDAYVEANNPNWGDIKVNVDGQTVSSDLVGGYPPEDQWYKNTEADMSTFTDEHTLYFWVCGNRNDAYFDNFRFLDANGDPIPPSEVVVGDDRTRTTTTREPTETTTGTPTETATETTTATETLTETPTETTTEGEEPTETETETSTETATETPTETPTTTREPTTIRKEEETETETETEEPSETTAEEEEETETATEAETTEETETPTETPTETDEPPETTEEDESEDEEEELVAFRERLESDRSVVSMPAYPSRV